MILEMDLPHILLSIFGGSALAFSIALYRTRTDTHPRLATHEWSDLAAQFTTFLESPDKLAVPMYGPYALYPTLPSPCPKHGNTRAPHRCDNAVEAMTLAVFDVDEGTEAQVLECQRLTRESGLTHIWHTSHSHGMVSDAGTVKVAWRLIFPLATPLNPRDWPIFRATLIGRFQIPVDAGKCKGRSHPWYFPSHPPGAQHALAYVVEGEFLAPPEPSNPRLARIYIPPVMFEPPPEPTGPVDMSALVDRLRERYRALMARTDPEAKRKGLWLRNMLAGKALAEHGSRNEATKAVTVNLAMVLDGQPLSVLRHLVRPSVEAMIQQGSTLTYEELDRMLTGAMRWWAQKKAEDKIKAAKQAEFDREMQAWLNDVPEIKN